MLRCMNFIKDDLGKKMMVGFVQETRGKLMRKVQKLGQICEGL